MDRGGARATRLASSPVGKPGKNESNYRSLAGEFLVLAELALRRIDGTLTLGHTKGIDVLVHNPDTGRTFKVEVKTTGKDTEREKPFGKNYAWLTSRMAGDRHDADLVYAFVHLGGGIAKPRVRRFFIVPATEVATYVRWSHRRHVRVVKHRRNPESAMRKFRIPVGEPTGALPQSWRDGRWRQWENNWAIFGPTLA